MSQHDATRTQLETELARLVKRADEIGGDLRQVHDRDWQERASELENDEVLEGLNEMTRAEVHRLRAALRRMANGTYGVCTTCGKAISDARLAAVPSTPTCLACSAK